MGIAYAAVRFERAPGTWERDYGEFEVHTDNGSPLPFTHHGFPVVVHQTAYMSLEVLLAAGIAAVTNRGK